MFVHDGDKNIPIDSMPGVYRLGWQHGLIDAVAEARSVGVNQASPHATPMHCHARSGLSWRCRLRRAADQLVSGAGLRGGRGPHAAWRPAARDACKHLEGRPMSRLRFPVFDASPTLPCS